MRTSDSIAALAAALATAQAEIKAAEEDRTASVQSEKARYSYGYATLASVWDACRGPLSKNGLSIAQFPETTFATITPDERGGQKYNPPSVKVTTRLMHKSGEWMESEIVLKADGDTPQKIGSAITYGRRYALSAMVGVAPDDDDGADASGVPTQFEQRRQAPQRPPEELPPKPAPAPEIPQLQKRLRDECGCKNRTDALAVLRFVLGDEWSKLPGECTGAEAMQALEGLDMYAAYRGPLAGVLEAAMTPS